MLVLWKEWGLDLILREAWKSGVVLAGLSAGAICWFEEGVTDSAVADQYGKFRFCKGAFVLIMTVKRPKTDISSADI